MNCNFVVFEGIDGSGKSTICQSVQKYFQNIHLVYEPNTELFKQIKYGQLFKSYQNIFFIWANRYQLYQKIPDVDLVIADRYYDSTYVYQTEIMHKTDIYNFNYSGIFYKPDLTFILDASLDTIKKRKTYNIHDNFENVNNQIIENRRQRYFNIIKQQKKWRKFIIITTDNLTIDQITKYCVDQITKINSPKTI